jgi:hypothetical protein
MFLTANQCHLHGASKTRVNARVMRVDDIRAETPVFAG